MATPSFPSLSVLELDDLDFAPDEAGAPAAVLPEAAAAAEAPEPDMANLELLDHHVEYLHAEGISAAVALASGCYSATEPAHLPVSLRRMWDGPGIVFAHTKLDGSVVPQYRPDAPTRSNAKGKLTKYYLPKACGNSFYISPLQAHLQGVATRAWIVEGTKGGLSVLTTLAESDHLDDVLLIFVTGVWGGLEDGVHSSDLLELVPRGAEITAFFDADFSSNLQVWKASDLLQRFVDKSYAGRTKLKFADVATSGSGGVSDFLGQLEVLGAEERWESIDYMATSALSKLPRKPAAKKHEPRELSAAADAAVSAAGGKVFVDLEVIARAVVKESGETGPGELLLDGAAIYLVAVHAIFDDFAKESYRTGEFDVAVKIGGAVHILRRVTSDLLDNPRRLLSQLPGGIGETVTVRPFAEREIGEAIRASAGRAGAELRVVTRIKRSGWYGHEYLAADGSTRKRFRYVTGSLAIGPRDSSVELTGEIQEPSLAGLEFEDPWLVSDAEAVDCVRELLRAQDECLVDPTPVIAAHGMMFGQAAGAGGNSEIGGVCLVGDPASGKTYLSRWILALQGAVWPKMSNFEGTSNFVAGVGKGVHHATVGVDDLRDRSKSNHRSAESQAEAFEAIMRRMWGGGEYTKGRQGISTGDVRSRAKDSNAPGFLMTAEPAALPDGHMNSNMTRGLFITTTFASTFRPGAAAAMKDQALAGIPHRVYGRFIRWVAGQVAAHQAASGDFETMDAWNSVVSGAMAKATAHLQKKFPGLPMSRVYQIAGNSLGGYQLFLTFAQAIGAIDDVEYAARRKQAYTLVGEAMMSCWVTYQGGGEQTSALDALVSAVFSGAYGITGITEPFGQGVGARRGKLGWVGHAEGEAVVYVDGKMAEAITGLKGKALGVALGDSILRQGSTYKRKVNTKAGQVYAYAIRRSAWGFAPSETSEDAFIDHAAGGAVVGEIARAS